MIHLDTNPNQTYRLPFPVWDGCAWPFGDFVAARNVIPSYFTVPQEYVSWLFAGQTDVLGIIQNPDGADQVGFIKPDAFPGERLYFKYPADWTVAVKNSPLHGERVKFDVPRHAWNFRRSQHAVNVRLVNDGSAE